MAAIKSDCHLSLTTSALMERCRPTSCDGTVADAAPVPHPPPLSWPASIPSQQAPTLLYSCPERVERDLGETSYHTRLQPTPSVRRGRKYIHTPPTSLSLTAAHSFSRATGLRRSLHPEATVGALPRPRRRCSSGSSGRRQSSASGVGGGSAGVTMDGGGGHRIEKEDGGVSTLKVTVGGREVRARDGAESIGVAVH